MKEKLIIKNFGSIKNVELEIGRFNVLIGEQGTGKSTVAKLLRFCRYFSNIEGGYLDEEIQEYKNFGLDTIRENLAKSGLYQYVNNDCFVNYECEHYAFRFSKPLWKVENYNPTTNSLSSGEEYHLTSMLDPRTPVFKHLLDEYSKRDSEGHLGFEFYEDSVAKILDFPFFVPTERGLQSFFSMGKDFTSNLSDPLFRYFVEMDKIQRRFNDETEILPLGIQYKNVDGKSEIRKDGEQRFFSLTDAASGYQSVIPIVLLLKYYSEIRVKRKTFLIEEPELNIFPTAQKYLINYLVENSVNFGHTILLTTHSPYILTSLNNLMYAYEVGAKEPEMVDEVIKKKYWINPEDVSAYRLMPDGTAKKIISTTEDGTLIEAGEIDEISSAINKEFDELIRIDMINEEKNEVR